MNTIAGAILIGLLIIVFHQYRQGTLGQWFAAKFFGRGGPPRPSVAAVAGLWTDPEGGGGGFSTGGGAGGGGGGVGAR